MSQSAGAARMRQKTVHTRTLTLHTRTSLARLKIGIAVGCRIRHMSSEDVSTDKGIYEPRLDRALLIAAEKTRIQYRNMPTAFVGSAVICTLMGLALVKGAGTAKVICWMAVVYT